MVFQCNGCESSFQEKKNLQQHMRIRHGFKKHKCSHCNFHSDDRTSVLRHEKAIHGNVINASIQQMINLIYIVIFEVNIWRRTSNVMNVILSQIEKI